MSEWRPLSGCTHDWREISSWTDERGVTHRERECRNCQELTEIVSAIDVHVWTATAVNGSSAQE